MPCRTAEVQLSHSGERENKIVRVNAEKNIHILIPAITLRKKTMFWRTSLFL